MKIAALAGGVGGAKLLIGLQKIAREDLTAIVNTGDDARIYGLHVSPDLDIVTYWLSGIADRERGWGVARDAFNVIDGLARLGQETWFQLGDRDLATCLYRTLRLDEGASLSAVTSAIATALGVAARLVPMSDDRVATVLRTADGRTLEFQEYFVKERTEPEIAEVAFEGIDDAGPAPGVLAAIADADVVIVCPSNPIVSISPILGVAGIRDALVGHPRVLAVSPIVRGAAVKGPADRLLESLGGESSASGVARLYADFCDGFAIDASDSAEASKVEAAGLEPIVTDTIMVDERASERLGRVLLGA